MKSKKQQAIENAWGVNWVKVENRADEDGWVDTKDIDFNLGDEHFETHSNFTNLIRPIELQGIEDNNGWMTIEEHGVPENGVYITIGVFDRGRQTEMNLPIFRSKFALEEEKAWWLKYITHYRPKTEFKKPIY